MIRTPLRDRHTLDDYRINMAAMCGGARASLRVAEDSACRIGSPETRKAPGWNQGLQAVRGQEPLTGSVCQSSQNVSPDILIVQHPRALTGLWER